MLDRKGLKKKQELKKKKEAISHYTEHTQGRIAFKLHERRFFSRAPYCVISERRSFKIECKYLAAKEERTSFMLAHELLYGRLLYVVTNIIQASEKMFRIFQCTTQFGCKRAT